MINKSITATIEVPNPPKDVFNHILDVSKWWGGKDLEGNTTKLNDEFTIVHPGAHYSKQRVIEFIPDKKIVWLVTESKLDWIEKNKSEWTNTKLIFEITIKGDKTVLHFTHEGLTPEKECYTKVEHGWELVIKDYLFKFITVDKAHFVTN